MRPHFREKDNCAFCGEPCSQQDARPYFAFPTIAYYHPAGAVELVANAAVDEDGDVLLTNAEVIHEACWAAYWSGLVAMKSGLPEG